MELNLIKEYDFLFKIVIVGSQGVGKSSIFLRFADSLYFQNYTATIGVDFKFKTLDVDHYQCKLQIWDTAGQQRFRTITSAYYKGAQAIIIVHDLSNQESFQELQSYWLGQVKNNAGSDTLLAILGSKMDLQRQASSQSVKSLADSLGIKAYDVSAKTGQGITQAFENICRDLIKLNLIHKTSKDKGSKLNQNQTRGFFGNCC